jgi:hypothetical protein
LLKYHSPLNIVFSFIVSTNVGWFDIINLAKPEAEGKITNNSMNYKDKQGKWTYFALFLFYFP